MLRHSRCSPAIRLHLFAAAIKVTTTIPQIVAFPLQDRLPTERHHNP